MNLLGRPVGIDDPVTQRIARGLGEVITADLLMVFRRPLLNAIPGTLNAGKGLRDRDVQDDRQVWPARFDRNVCNRADLLGGQTISAKLVRKRRGDESVADNSLTRRQPRHDRLGHHLSTGRHVEKHFASHRHLGVGGVKEDSADLFADARSAGVADNQRCQALLLQGSGKEFDLCGLARTFGAIQDNETRAKR